MAPQKKITLAEAHEWIKNAISACTLEALESTDDLTQEFLDETRPMDFQEPKKPKASKKTSETKTSSSSSASDRSEEGYDEERCDARASKKQHGVRFDYQCSSKKLDGECFCKNHLKKSETGKGLELGKITGDRPTHWFSEEPISWHDADPELLAEKKTKKTKKTQKTTDDGEKKPRKCSVCAVAGHTKRTCPQVTDKSSHKSSDEETEQFAKDITETVDDMITQIETEKTSVPEDDGAGTGLLLEPDTSITDAFTVPVADTETLELPDHSDDESDEEDNVAFGFQGIPYERDASGSVFDDDGDKVGNWDGEKVDWINSAFRKQHESKISEMGEASPESVATPTLLELDAKDLRKMARALEVDTESVDDAWDSDNRKESLIELIRNAQPSA